MNIAIIDDQADIRYAVEKILSKKGHTCYGFTGHEEDLIDGIDVFDIDLIILDMMLGDSLTGVEVLQRIRDADFAIPTILITAYATASNIINATKSGIVDIIEKPFSTRDILEAVSRYEKKEPDHPPLQLRDREEEFIGSLKTMREVYNGIGMAARSDVTVSVFGESGTGKSFVARLIHQNSPRAQEPFVTVNCAALEEENFDALFLGDGDKRGYLAEVGNGTLFLDEMLDLSPPLQGRLLNFLETGRLDERGGKKPFEGRIICSFSASPQEIREQKLIRKDLYHRVTVLEIELPTLKRRKEDIEELALHFVTLANRDLNLSIRSIDGEALSLLKEQNFPGNVRELKNILYKAALTAPYDRLTIDEIESALRPCDAMIRENPAASIQTFVKRIVDAYGPENAEAILHDIEKELLSVLLGRCSISSLARYLGISRNTLKSKIERYGLSGGSSKEEEMPKY